MAQGYLDPVRRGGLRRRARVGPGSLFNLHRQMNSLFDDLFDQEPEGQTGGGRMGFPALELSDQEDRIEICAELPGVKEDDVDLSIEDGVLTLCGEKRSERNNEETGYSERSYGRFERRVSLPSNIDEDACNAHFADGVLTVTIPKSEEKTRGRRIPVGRQQSASGGSAEDALIDQKDDAAKRQTAKKDG